MKRVYHETTYSEHTRCVYQSDTPTGLAKPLRSVPKPIMYAASDGVVRHGKRGDRNARSHTGGAPRKSWAYRSQNAAPSACRTLSLEEYLRDC